MNLHFLNQLTMENQLPLQKQWMFSLHAASLDFMEDSFKKLEVIQLIWMDLSLLIQKNNQLE